LAEVRPFRGIRYAPGAVRLADVVCAPYDVITPEAQADYYARSEHNAVRLELGRDEPGDDATRNRYTRAAEHLRAWLRAGVLQRDDVPGFYVYEESFVLDGREGTRRGFFAAVRLEEWDRRVVLPHERTMTKPRADRLSLLRACRTQLSPILALYEDPSGRIAAALEAATRGAPAAEFELRPGAVVAAATGHRLWHVDDPRTVDEVRRALAGRPLFVADGHHRYETALEHWREVRRAGADGDHPAGWALMLLADVADPGLVVLPTHRLVRVPTPDRSALLQRLRRYFTVEEHGRGPGHGDGLASLLAEVARRSASAHAIGIAGLAADSLHLLTAEPGPELEAWLPSDRSTAWKSLDVAVLHCAVLEGLLGLHGEAAADGHLAYTRDAHAALAAVSSGGCDLAFFLNATRISQIRDVALAGDRMPEKSTYFWPKPPTGVVFYGLDGE